MGAVSSILYTASNPNIRLLVLDSPFEDLAVLLKEYIDKFKVFGHVSTSNANAFRFYPR